MKRILYILILFFCLIFIGACNKIDAKENFDNAILLGREGNYTFKNDYIVKRNNNETSYTIYNKLANNGMSIITNDGMNETCLCQKDNKFFKITKVEDSILTEEITYDDYKQSKVNFFDYFDYQDFECLKSGVYSLDERAFEKYFDKIFTSIKPFTGLESFKFDNMYLELYIDDGVVVKILAGCRVEFKIDTIKYSYEYDYLMNFYDYKVTSIDLAF